VGRTFVTERLSLRPFTLDDVPDLHQLYLHQDVWAFDPGHEQSEAEVTSMVQYRIWQYERNGFGALAITHNQNGALIGHCGLQTYVWEHLPVSSVETELFFKLGRDYWSRGYATEACRAVLGFAFDELRLPRIVSWTHRENARSLVLMRRLGMDLRADRAAGDDAGLIAGTIENRRRG
jgi:RimJ/RimL family protein N-acetyltransferase